MKLRVVLNVPPFLCLFLVLLPLNSAAQDLIILHTNDLHSRLNGFYPEAEYTPLVTNDDLTLGGFSRIASIIKNERKEHPHKVLVLDAGDFMMGTLFHQLEPSTGFQISLMGKMGYDIIALGNHEFDFGPRILAQIINKGMEKGPIPQLTISNIQFDKHSSKDDALEALYRDSVICPCKLIHRNGLKIGVFGLLGKDAESSAPGSKPMSFANPIRTARQQVRFLKKAGADFIIALSHSGIEKDRNGQWTGEDIELARRVKDLDFIISGHSHTKLTKPIRVNNTFIFQTGAFGTQIGKIEIDLKNRLNVKSQLIEVNDSFVGDPKIQHQIDEQAKLIKTIILNPLGLHYNQNIFETDFPLVLNRNNNIEAGNLGPFIADAILNETNLLEGGYTNIALIPAGMIRGNILPGKNGLQTTADLFNTLSLGLGQDSVPGYPLSRVFLTASELKKVVELLLISYQSGTSRYMYYSGLRATYNPKKFFFQQVQSLEVKNNQGIFEVVDLNNDDKLYGLVGNSYLLNFFYLIKEMSFGLVQVTPKNSQGQAITDMADAVLDFDQKKPGIQEGKEWITVINFAKTFNDIDNNGIPDMPISYKEKINPVYIFNRLPGSENLVKK